MQQRTHPIPCLVSARRPAAAWSASAARLLSMGGRGNRPAFTMIELLVVIGIIVLIVGLAYPIMGALSRGNRIEAGLNTVNVAIAAARTASTQAKASMDPPVTGARFSGAAVIFTPAGEMRLVEHYQPAANSFGTYLAASNRHGYADITSRAYITLPPGSAVVGISRISAGAPLLLAPPFAIHFNEYGNLIAGQDTDRSVYYDGNNYDSAYEVSWDRHDSYNADAWDPGLTTPIPPPWVAGAAQKMALQLDTQGRYNLPFERFETVIGVIVYDRNAFRSARYQDGHPNGYPNKNPPLPITPPLTLAGNGAAGGGINDAARNWLLGTTIGVPNGKVLLVDRYSGSLLRQ